MFVPDLGHSFTRFNDDDSDYSTRTSSFIASLSTAAS